MTDAQRKAQRKYQNKTYVQIPIKLHKELDADIIAKLHEIENRAGYIKNLIRKDLNL